VPHTLRLSARQPDTGVIELYLPELGEPVDFAVLHDGPHLCITEEAGIFKGEYTPALVSLNEIASVAATLNLSLLDTMEEGTRGRLLFIERSKIRPGWEQYVADFSQGCDFTEN
jgi:hypothetical protein